MSIKNTRSKIYIRLILQSIYTLGIFYFFLPLVIDDPLGASLVGGFLPNIINFVFIWVVGVILIGFYLSKKK